MIFKASISVKSKCFLTFVIFSLIEYSLYSQTFVSTADNDFYVNDTLRLDPSQIQLVQTLPTPIRRTLSPKPKMDGWIVYYFISAYKYTEGILKNKKREGIWTSYYDSGTVSSKITFIDDVKNGPCEYYYKTAQLNATGQYKNDKKEGEWTYYNKDGTIKGVFIFKAGEIIEQR